MPVFAKRFLSVALIAGFCFHFGFIFICASPIKTAHPKINFLSNQYCTPFIYQNWSLFVPAPKTTLKLFVRYKTEKGWSSWNDVLQTQILKNKNNRITGHENTVLLFSNALHYALNSFPDQSSFNIGPKNDMNFFILKYEIDQYLKLKVAIKENTHYEILINTNVANQSVSHYIKYLNVASN